MEQKTIAFAADHAGFERKELLKNQVQEWGYRLLDLGTDGTEPVDYPDYADLLAKALLEGEADMGVLVCGTGVGISIAANRHGGIRAALCHDETTARLSRDHNDANVLALGARTTGEAISLAVLETFLRTPFGAGRHQRRVDKLR